MKEGTEFRKYATKHMGINSTFVDHYIESSLTPYIIEERSLNMTQMSEEEIKKETIKWLDNLNKAFGNLLAKEKLIKTGGYDKISKHQNTKARKDTVHRNTTTVETLNYATQEGTVR